MPTSPPAGALYRAPVELARSYLLLNHGPVTLVSSAHRGRRNVMAASWAMALDFNPAKVAVVIDRRTLTRELVDASGEFVLNVPTRALAGLTFTVGNSSGRDGDKFARHGIATAPPTGSPSVDRRLRAWLECRVIPEPRNQQGYDLFLAEVVAAHADPGCSATTAGTFPTTPAGRSTTRPAAAFSRRGGGQRALRAAKSINHSRITSRPISSVIIQPRTMTPFPP